MESVRHQIIQFYVNIAVFRDPWRHSLNQPHIVKLFFIHLAVGDFLKKTLGLKFVLKL
jgi:hypothetical protein